LRILSIKLAPLFDITKRMEINEVQFNQSAFRVVFGDSWTNLTDILSDSPFICLVDRQVFDLYQDQLNGMRCILVESGEASKSLTVLQRMIEQLIAFQADRDTLLLAIGGGVVCDLTGFIASIYMRGCRVAYVPTTLLAMVDASYGGKTGINFLQWKNLLGTIRQPEFIFTEISFLNTLPVRELRAGLSESIKHAMIGSSARFDWIEKHHTQLLNLDQNALKDLVIHSVHFKLSVVAQDEKEIGLRRILNFGHTFGHAIERSNLYNHGESVALGMIIACKISELHCNLDPAITNRLIRLLDSLGLPTHHQFDPDLLISHVALDKKKSGSKLHFVFLKNLETPIVEKVDNQLLLKYLKEMA
jgi:3-dehydroquinate synthase